MEKPNKVHSTHAVECKGLEGTSITNFKDSLEAPVQVLITTFEDGYREVCCPHLGMDYQKDGCKAKGEGPYPYCYYRRPKEDQNSTQED